MTDDEVEGLRQQKMRALKEAREAYRKIAVSTDPLLSKQVPSLLKEQLQVRQDAVKAAESALRAFNQEHPRR
jgi:hypothetical protein